MEPGDSNAIRRAEDGMRTTGGQSRDNYKSTKKVKHSLIAQDCPWLTDLNWCRRAICLPLPALVWSRLVWPQVTI